MKIRISHLRAFTLISLLSLFAFVARTGAQDNISKQLNGSPELLEKAGKTHKAKIPGATPVYEVLYSFCSAANCADGYSPAAGLIQDAAGNLYGTDVYGGANGGGAVFKLDSTGDETVLYSFCSVANCTDGLFPEAVLIQDTAGNLYSTTIGGGNSNSHCLHDSCGTVFKLDSAGQETALYSFCSEPNCSDGSIPHAGVIQDAAGNLYGTTNEGANLCSFYGGGEEYGCGTVYKVNSAGQETVLHTFCSASGCTDGAVPTTALVQDEAGNLYGTTGYGGANGKGAVFEVSSTGQETVLYSFCSASGCKDGNGPAGVIRDAAGNLYGTTAYGGANGHGTVFELDNKGIETVLYSFCSEGGKDCTDGYYPAATLTQDTTGNFYGTTYLGGVNGVGTVFELDSTGHETVLYSFCSASGCTDGSYPGVGPLIQDAAGNLYGTTICGGANAGAGGSGCTGAGTVFKLELVTATVTLTSSPNPAYVEQPVTFSVMVSGAGPIPTGSVTFEEGRTALGSVTLADGQASLTTTLKKSGSFLIVAIYSGDQNYNGANSSPLTQVVQKQYTTTTTLTSSFNPSTYGEAVTFIATVSSSGPTPTGTVTFKNGSKTIGSATLSDGAAQITTSALPVGNLAITASYGGDVANAKSTSPTLQQVVNQATSATTVASSLNPSEVGQKVTFTATVTSPTTTPTGTVKFMDGSTELGTGTLKKGKATYSTSTLSEGSHNITAVYEGTVDVIGSTSPVLVQTVN
jgi:uncharacterized repeat protein (TIGR03803 family)